MKNFYNNFNFKLVNKIIEQALSEDIGKGDVTSNLFIPKKSFSEAVVLFKDNGIIAGLEIFKRFLKQIDDKIKIKFFVKEGDYLKYRTVIGKMSGNTRNILKGERVALNLLQRMSGIATSVYELQKRLNNKNIKIIDTRKTTPNLRLFEKLAVKIGGGDNHRFGLFDMILIKDNHIEANGGIDNILEMLKKIRKKTELKLEIEVKSLSEFKKVFEMGKDTVDVVMLDNFGISKLKEVLKLNNGRFKIEISGGINLDNISKYSKIKGIDYISVGAVTHSVKSADISLDFIT